MRLAEIHFEKASKLRARLKATHSYANGVTNWSLSLLLLLV
jgi:hypothetical protein